MQHVSLCLLSYQRPEMFYQSFVSLEKSLVGAANRCEIIVNDDCSTDPRMVELLCKLHIDGRISSLILNAAGKNSGNQGVGESFRKALGVSSGEYVIKADADLLYRRDWLDGAIEIMETFPIISNLGAFHYYHSPVHADECYIKTVEENGICAELVKDSVGSFMLMRREMLENIPWTSHSNGFAEDFVWKRETEKAGFYCALPVNDFCQNVGFGLGRSTVCYADSNSENGIAVTKIHNTPLLFP